MEPVRLRLLFDDRHLLSNSLKLEGLKRSWLLLRPELETISDFASHVAKTFHLEDACPNGLVLSMDGFVLPPFESTHVLKDKDIIRVKRKVVAWTDVIRVNDETNSIEDSEIMGKQPVLTGAKPLEIEYERETGGYQSENEADEHDGVVYSVPMENASGGKATSKKRKPSKEHTKLKVKRKVVTSTDVIRVNDETNSIEDSEIMEKQPVLTRAKPLEIEYERETGGYQSENEAAEHDGAVYSVHMENASGGKATSKKRKPSKEHTNSKRKKARSTSNENCTLVPEAVENNVCMEQNGSLHPKGVLTNKSIQKKDKLSNAKAKSSRECSSIIAEEVHKTSESTPKEDRCGQPEEDDTEPEEDDTEHIDLSNAANGAKKFPSRSARRKKAKRRWLREVKSQEREELRETGQINQSHAPGEGSQEKFIEHQQPYQNTDEEDEIVPIVVRPGHIRFEPIDEGQIVQQNKDEETFQWKGTTSKKKGQKWGLEKTFSCRKKDDHSFNQDSTEKLTMEGELVHDYIDFDSLAPFSIPPKEGNVIAYRLVELSSSWCPELSSFRVGKVSWYDSGSNKVMLIPVPRYPIGERLDDDASGMQPDSSLYREDGSLEIDFASLVDVRIVHHDNSNPAAVVGAGTDVHVSDHEAIPGVAPNGNTVDIDTPATGNGGQVNLWEEFSQALCQKKAQLSQNGWPKNESSGRSAWSYKALRSSALGPTMALLRARNEM